MYSCLLGHFINLASWVLGIELSLEGSLLLFVVLMNARYGEWQKHVDLSVLDHEICVSGLSIPHLSSF